MLKDLRHAVRLLFANKVWTMVVVVSLALGIGANTAIFTAINGLLLRTLPVDRPDALVRFRNVGENDMGTNFSDYARVENTGGVTLAAAAAVLTGVAAVAGYVPARTAVRVDPMVALRNE